ncbi:MAG: 4Fe-4S dicluster domain-containing protein [Spartobacteria bacterium]|nr:4Fe-4S dicluster domain-containing protein [Spartobacteria bacterium]
MSRRGNIARWCVRLLMLALAFFFAWGGPWPGWMEHLFPALSPFAAFASAVAHRGWYRAVYWLLPPLALLTLAVFRGRFFCRWVCPAGTLYAVASTFSLKKQVLRWRISPFLFWFTLAGALLGAPLFLFTDPLAAFNRSVVTLSGLRATVAMIPGVIVPLFMLLSLVQPMLWCSRFCPLGYTFDLVKLTPRPVSRRFHNDRRQIVAGLAAGLPLALLASSIPIHPGRKRTWPILPPGALNADDYAERCSRCYACVNACPSRVLNVRFSTNRSWAQFCQPELTPDSGVCDEYCNRCSLVCHTGAIQPVSEDEKRYRKIGTAVINKDACLAWSDEQYCMVCDEYCPYNAIHTDTGPTGFPRPVVLPDQCRGCGMCQHNCPAIRAGKAIIVEGLAEQREIPANDLYDI